MLLMLMLMMLLLLLLLSLRVLEIAGRADRANGDILVPIVSTMFLRLLFTVRILDAMHVLILRLVLVHGLRHAARGEPCKAVGQVWVHHAFDPSGGVVVLVNGSPAGSVVPGLSLKRARRGGVKRRRRHGVLVAAAVASATTAGAAVCRKGIIAGYVGLEADRWMLLLLAATRQLLGLLCLVMALFDPVAGAILRWCPRCDIKPVQAML